MGMFKELMEQSKADREMDIMRDAEIAKERAETMRMNSAIMAQLLKVNLEAAPAFIPPYHPSGTAFIPAPPPFKPYSASPIVPGQTVLSAPSPANEPMAGLSKTTSPPSRATNNKSKFQLLLTAFSCFNNL
jgi:hypothetical protein